MTVEQIITEVEAGRLDIDKVLGFGKCQVCGDLVPVSSMCGLTYDGRQACEPCWNRHEAALYKCEQDTIARIRAELTPQS